MLFLSGYVSGENRSLTEDDAGRVRAFAEEHDVPLEQTDLSPRSKNVLRYNNIRFLSQLLAMNEADFSSLNLMTEACAEEIRMLSADYLERNADLIRQTPVPKNEAPATELLSDESGRRQIMDAFRAAGRNCPVEELSLSVRAYNCMKRMKKDDVCGLIELYPDGYQSIRNVGAKTVDELMSVVERYVARNGGLVRAFMAGEDVSPCAAGNTEGGDGETRTSGQEPAEEQLLQWTAEADIKSLLRYDAVRARLAAFISEHDLPIKALGLSNRSFKAMQLAGLNSLSAMLAYYPDGFAGLKNVGAKSVLELQETVEAFADRMRREYLADAAHPHDGTPKQYPEEQLRQCVLDCFKGLGFKGLHYQEIREQCPADAEEAQLKRVIGRLIREKELEYVDFRCYRTYPSVMETARSSDKLNSREKDVFFRRLGGETLDAIGKDYGVTRERVRQLEAKAVRKVLALSARSADCGMFDEEYYVHFYQTYDIPADFRTTYSGVAEGVWRLLDYLYRKGDSPLENAISDPELDVPLKIRVSDYLNRDRICLDGKTIGRNRQELENHVIRNYCREETTFDEFVELYNRVLAANYIDYDPELYLTEEVRATRQNRVEESRICLWKYGKRFRFYDIDAGDYGELYEALGLEEYENTEVTTLKFMEEYPELMRNYDIRDEYELHNLIRKTVDPGRYHSLDLKRQPTLCFGVFDREAAIREILSVFSPVRADELEAYLHAEYGYSLATMRATYLVPFSRYLTDGVYDVSSLQMPPERKAALNAALTEDLYPIKRIVAIYRQLFPEAPEGELHAGELKDLGFRIYSEYALRNYGSLDEYFARLLTEHDTCTIRDKMRRYSATSTFYSVYRRLKRQQLIFLYEPDGLITLRKLERCGVSREELRDFADAVNDAVEDESFFNMHSLREQGFSTSLDRLGFDDYFFNELLAEDPRFARQHVFGTIVLRKTDDAGFNIRDFLLALVSDYESIELDTLMDLLRDEYGISEPDQYKIVELIRESNDGVYYDGIMRTVYRDKSCYLSEFDE